MTNERISELMIYFETSKKATEYLLSSDNFDDSKKITAKIAYDIFIDTLECLKIAMQNNKDEISISGVEVNNGDDSGQQSE